MDEAEVYTLENLVASNPGAKFYILGIATLVLLSTAGCVVDHSGL